MATLPRRENRARPLRLHLGCGSDVVPGWENIDKSPNVYLARSPWLRKALFRARVLTREQAEAVFPRGIIRANVRNGLPYAAESVSDIYSSHLIEHLSRWQALELLKEGLRVLRPGGLIRLATPNLATLIQGYQDGLTAAGPTPADSFMYELFTFREEPGSFAQRMVRRLAHAPHQWVYDAASLSALLLEAGFEDPVVCDYRQGQVPDLERLENRPDSLFMEAARPYGRGVRSADRAL